MATSKNENRARRILVGKELKELADIFEKYQWNVLPDKLCMLMSMTFYPDYGIRFKPYLGEEVINRNVAIQLTYPNKDIEIQLTQKASDFVESFNDLEDRYYRWIDDNNNSLIQEIKIGLAEQLDIRDNLQKIWEYFGTLEMEPIQFFLQNYFEPHVGQAVEEIKENNGVSKMLGLYQLVFGEKSEEYKTFEEAVKKEAKRKTMKAVF